MPERMIPTDISAPTASTELFYAKNLGLLAQWSHTLSLRTIEEMEISGMHLGNGYFLLGLMHIADHAGRDSGRYLGTLSAEAQALMRQTLSRHFLCHIGSMGGDLLLLLCFPHTDQPDAPELLEAKAACKNVADQFRDRFPAGRFLLLLSPPFSGYAQIHNHYANLTQRLNCRLFLGEPSGFLSAAAQGPETPANPQYTDNDEMTRLASRMATAIGRCQYHEIQALEEETLTRLFSGHGDSLSPVHFRLYVYLCALLKHLETRGIVDRRFTRRRDFFRDLTNAPCHQAFCQQFHHLIQSVLDHCNAARQTPTSGAARLRQIRDYCQSHYTSPELTVSSLAALFGLSQPQLSAPFKRQFGENPLAYLNRLRLQAVKRLLADTDKGQEEISTMCGFSNVTTMQRLFQRTEHCTPGQYRTRV